MASQLVTPHTCLHSAPFLFYPFVQVPFGQATRKEYFWLGQKKPFKDAKGSQGKESVFLNAGSYGATPKPVMDCRKVLPPPAVILSTLHQ